MRKQTKLVAVLSATALLALGASMTSFAAGWEKDESGIWHYYDEDDELVTDEWKKDGGKWFYLDEDGDMLTNGWVDDDYYVGEDGAMIVNGWVKTYPDEDQDDPDEDGEYWYYFGSKGKKVVDEDKKINGKTYYFDEDGKMLSGWQMDGADKAVYLGTEDEGWRAESQWLWLEKSGLIDNDDDDDEINGVPVYSCDEDDDCDDEGWYWFNSSGKAINQVGKKKINGRWYMFNNHGQMLYEWIDSDTNVTHSSNAQLDDSAKKEGATTPNIEKIFYYNEVEDGSRANGWYQIDGVKDLGTSDDTDWYYIDDGDITYADQGDKNLATYDDDGAVFVKRKKIDGKYFAFNEVGQMQTGLQYAPNDTGFYYFDENGYQKTGKVTGVECDDDDYTFYFTTKNGKNGQGYKGEKDGYLYFNGKRLEADDDNRLYLYDGDIYLVNTKGKIQKAKTAKKYDIENNGISEDDVLVKTDSNGKVEYIRKNEGKGKILTKDELLAELKADLTNDNDEQDLLLVTDDTIVSVPFIQLYDDDIYTYKKLTITSTTEKDKDGNDVTTSKVVSGEGWLGVNDETSPYYQK